MRVNPSPRERLRDAAAAICKKDQIADFGTAPVSGVRILPIRSDESVAGGLSARSIFDCGAALKTGSSCEQRDRWPATSGSPQAGLRGPAGDPIRNGCDRMLRSNGGYPGYRYKAQKHDPRDYQYHSSAARNRG